MKVVHCKKEPYTYYIGRPSGLGNPFAIKADTLAKEIVASREEAIQKYEDYARGNPEIMEIIESLPENSVLGCWCSPKACHGDVIVKIWKELHNV